MQSLKPLPWATAPKACSQGRSSRNKPHEDAFEMVGAGDDVDGLDGVLQAQALLAVVLVLALKSLRLEVTFQHVLENKPIMLHMVTIENDKISTLLSYALLLYFILIKTNIPFFLRLYQLWARSIGEAISISTQNRDRDFLTSQTHPDTSVYVEMAISIFPEVLG